MRSLDELFAACVRCGADRPERDALAGSWHGMPLYPCCNGPSAELWIACRGCWPLMSVPARLMAAVEVAEALARAAGDDVPDTIAVVTQAVLAEAGGYPALDCGRHG